MEVRVLGTVQVVSNGQSILRARRQERLLLGLLALEANRAITISRLEQLLWNVDAPQNPRLAIQVYVSRLRTQLEAVDASTIDLVHQGSGYVLRIDPQRVDALRFGKAVAAARSTSDPRQRARRLGEALAMWRGPLLEDAADDLLRARIGQGLEEQRLTAIEHRVEAELETGSHEAMVSELADLSARYPLRERLIAARMTALHQSGRTPEALAVYRQAAAVLREQSGLEFGKTLKDIYVSILRADAPPKNAAGQTAAKAAVPAQLPPDPSVFVGRRPEIDRLTAPVPDPARGRTTAHAVDGMPGVGKTALVLHVAHRVAERYPDGQLYLNLRGFTRDSKPVEAAEVLDRVLRALGMPAREIPRHTDDRAAAFRSLVARRKLLFVFDNAADADQVEPLLPAATGCLVYITSRSRLSDLDNVTFTSLPPLSAAESAELFRQVAGAERIGDGAEEITNDVVHSCGRLPLAVRIAAARIRDDNALTMSSLLERLRDSETPLSELTTGRRGVGAALELSYRDLDSDTRGVFRMLGMAPAMPVDALAAAALANLTTGSVEPILSALTSARMLDSHTADRYEFHDLIRHYAIERADSEDTAETRRAALGRLLGHYQAMVALAAHRIDPSRFALKDDADPDAIPDYPAAMAWLDDMRHQLKAAIVRGHAEGFHRQVWVLSARLASYYFLRGHHDDWLTTHQIGLLSTTALSDDQGRAYMLLRIAYPYKVAGDLAQALSCCEEAAELFEKLGDVISQAGALNNFGWMVADSPISADTAVFDAARKNLEKAVGLFAGIEDALGQARTLDSLGDICRVQQRFDDALRYYRRSLALARTAGQLDDQAAVLHGIGVTHIEQSQYRLAIEALTEALALSREAGADSRVPRCLESLGNAHRRMGELTRAAEYHRKLKDTIPELDSGLVTADMHHSIADTFAAIGDAETAMFHYRMAEDQA